MSLQLKHKQKQINISDHPYYSRWEGMMSRCYNKNNKRYPSYGGRGIIVSEEFKTSGNYIFYIESLPKPLTDRKLTIDRVNNNGNYERGNLRWADQTRQNFNQRLNRRNRSGYRGITYDKARAQWRVRINIMGVEHYLGRFTNIHSAVKARDSYAPA